MSHSEFKSYVKYLIIGVWSFILLLLTVFLGYWESHQQNPNQDPESYQSNGARILILDRNRDNHYVVSGTVNGKVVEFLIDTGATSVVVPMHLQHYLGLSKGVMGIAITANGRVNTFATKLNSLQIGKIQLQNVNASLNPGMQGPQILLGMSALKNLDFAKKGTQLIITQH